MADDALALERRIAMVDKALVGDATVLSLTTAPNVTTWNQVGAVPDPKAIVVHRVAPGGEGRVGWNGAVIERYAIDVFVDEKAAADPPGRAALLAAAVDAALGAAALRAALAALTPAVTTIEAVARRATEWEDVPAQGPEGTAHKTADVEISYVAL